MNDEEVMEASKKAEEGAAEYSKDKRTKFQIVAYNAYFAGYMAAHSDCFSDIFFKKRKANNEKS